MTFSKSNLNLLPESLFTELTADQAQMLEGGKRITILLVRCIKAGADRSGADELLFTINGQDPSFGRPIDMVTGGVANVGVAANFNGTANVSLFDKDTASGNDFIGSFSASNNTNGSKTVRVSGSGSTYDVTYQVTN
jgi:hypothetical protein